MKRSEMKNLKSRINNQILRCTENDNLGSLPYILTFSLVSDGSFASKISVPAWKSRGYLLTKIPLVFLIV